jgi:O-antigen ligase
LSVVATTVVVLSLLLIVMGIASYHSGFMSDELLAGTAVPRIQALGNLNNPNNLSQATLMALPLLGLYWTRGELLKNALFVFLPAGILVYGIYLTRSRSAVIGLAALGFLIVQRRGGGVWRIVMLLALLALPAVAPSFSGGRGFSGEDESFQGRVYAWRAGIGMLRSSPVWGVGYGTYGENNVENGLAAHNSFVQCFAELGLIGYFFWLALLVLTLRQLSAVRQLSPADSTSKALRRWADVLRMSLYCFLVTTLAMARTYFAVLYLFLGMATALIVIARLSGKEMARLSFPKMGLWVLGLEVASIGSLYLLVNVLT